MKNYMKLKYLDIDESILKSIKGAAKLLANGKYLENIYSNIKTNKKSQEIQIDTLKKTFQDEKLVLVLGAGVSAHYQLPDWDTLLQKLLLDTLKSEPNETEESSRVVSNIFTKVFNNSPLISARYLSAHYNSTDSFEEAIRGVLYNNVDKSKDSNTIKEIVQFCTAPGRTPNLDSIITYNYDDILESALDKSAVDIRYRSIYSIGINPEYGELPIYHVHGFLPQAGKLNENNRITLSESIYHQQYNEIYSWNNIVQINKFREKTCLFIGTSFTDPNLRRLLDIAMIQRGKDNTYHYLFKKRHTQINIEEKLKILLDNDNKLLEEKTTADLNLNDTACRLIKIMEKFEEHDANSFGVEIIWIDDFLDIPEILKQIRK